MSYTVTSAPLVVVSIFSCKLHSVAVGSVGRHQGAASGANCVAELLREDGTPRFRYRLEGCCTLPNIRYRKLIEGRSGACSFLSGSEMKAIVTQPHGVAIRSVSETSFEVGKPSVECALTVALSD